MTKFTICIMNDKEISEHERRACERAKKRMRERNTHNTLNILYRHSLHYVYICYYMHIRYFQFHGSSNNRIFSREIGYFIILIVCNLSLTAARHVNSKFHLEIEWLVRNGTKTKKKKKN